MENAKAWKIVFYQDHRGKSPPLEFINKLQPRDRARVFNALRLLEEFGTQLGMPHARAIEGPLWELRPGPNRLLYFVFTENRFVIVHGFRKKTNQTPKKEVGIAKERMRRLLEE